MHQRNLVSLLDFGNVSFVIIYQFAILALRLLKIAELVRSAAL
jgi:hypothetical protein